MGSLIYYGALFLAKVLDNALSTTKTILIQRSRWLLAGIAVVLSDFIYFWLTKRIVSGDNNWAILIVSLAGGVGYAAYSFMHRVGGFFMPIHSRPLRRRRLNL